MEESSRRVYESCDLLYEFPAEIWLTVYRRLDIAKRARVEPRTQMHMTMEKLFWRRVSSTSVLGISGIVLDNVLKLWIALRTQRNDNAREKFYRVQRFRKVDIFGRNFEIFENFKKSKDLRDELLLYELFEREPG